MFTIKSYLKKPQVPITNLWGLNSEPEKYFIELDCKETILKYSNKLNLRYLEGVIIIQKDLEVIMDFTYYDLIDHLWAYFLNILDELTFQKVAYTYFPDQPIKMKIRVVDVNWMVLTLSMQKEKKNGLCRKMSLLARS